MNDTMSLLIRARAGDPAARAALAERLVHGAFAWHRCNFEMALERFCGLNPPTARRKLARMEAHYWLCVAAQQIEAPTPWQRSVALAHELETFISRVWPACRGNDDPPADASELRTALFKAVRADPGMRTGVRTLHRVTAEVDQTAPVNPFGELQMKTRAQINRDAEIEWGFLPTLQAEFGNNLATYQAFRRAEHAGKLKFSNTPDCDKNLAGVGTESPG